MVFNTVEQITLPDNSILITANMQSEMGFPSSHQLKSYVASKSRLKLAARSVLSADAGLLVITANMQSETGFPSSHQLKSYVGYTSRLKLAARAVLSADVGLLVSISSVEALQGKMCQKSLLSGGGRSD